MDKRLFIATKIKFTQQVYGAFHYIKDNLAKGKIKWTDMEQSHITLKFLGQTDEELIPQIEQELAQIAIHTQPTTVKMQSIGVFPNMRRPRVLWLGLEENQILTQLASDIDLAMSGLGFQREERDFRPHITLGRIKFLPDRQALEHIIDKYSGYYFQDIPVRQIILYQSELMPQGPVYTALARFDLGRKP